MLINDKIMFDPSNASDNLDPTFSAFISGKSVTSSKSLTPAGGNSAVYMVPPLRRLNAPIILRRNSTSKTHYYLQPSSAVFSETINPSFREAFSSANIQRISVSSLSLFPPDSYLSQETVYSTIVEHSLNWEQNSTQQYKNNDSNVSSSYYLQNTIIPTAVKSSTSESSVDKSTMFLQNIHSTQQDVNDTIAYSIVNSALNSSWNISDIKQSLFHTPTHVSYTVIESNISSATMALSYNIKPLFSVPVNATPTQVPYSPVASVFKVLSLSAIQTIRTKQSLSDSPDMSLIIVPTPISEHGLPSIWPDFSVSSKSDIRSSNAFESLWNSSIVWSSVISPISDSHGHFLFPSSGTSLEHHSRSTGYPSMSFSDSELIPETFSAPPLYGQTISSQPRTDDFKASISSKTVSITLAASSDITFASTTSLPALTALTNYSTVLWNNGKTSVSQSVGATLSVPITASIASGFTSRTSSSVLVFLPNSISSSPMSTDRTIASSASISATLSSSIPAPTAFVSSSVSIPTALTCAQMKSYFPSYIEIDESEPVGM